jgi:hypothetical protein
VGGHCRDHCDDFRIRHRTGLEGFPLALAAICAALAVPALRKGRSKVADTTLPE